MAPEQSEEWRSVAGQPGYEVSSLGRVRCWLPLGRSKAPVTEPRLKRPNVDKDGYFKIGFRHGSRMVFVHALVCEAFHGPRPDGAVVRHFPDRTRTNCCASNLQWGSPKENSADSIRDGTMRRGDAHPTRKAPWRQAHERNARARLVGGNVRLARMLVAEKVDTQRAIARVFGVHYSTVGYACNGNTWKDY